MNQRLRAIINTFGLSSRLQVLVVTFTWHFGPNVTGTLISDMHTLGSSPKTEDQDHSKTAERLDRHISELLDAYEERKALQEIGISGGHESGGGIDMQPESTRTALSWKRGIRLGVKHDQFGRWGATFSSFHRTKWDSYVAVGRKVPDDWHAGRIVSIFTYTHEGPMPKLKGHAETYFVVQKFKELTETDAIHDPYRRHPVAGRLFYDMVEKDPELMPVNEILCHIAYTPLQSPQITLPCIHVLPLDRVCTSYWIFLGMQVLMLTHV